MELAGFDFNDLAIIMTILSPLIWKFVEFAKYVRADDRNAITTLGVVWVTGILLAFLLRETDFAPSIGIGDDSLAHLNWASVLFIGLAMGSLASVGYDFKKAFDRTDTAATPALLPEETKVVDPATGEATDPYRTY